MWNPWIIKDKNKYKDMYHVKAGNDRLLQNGAETNIEGNVVGKYILFVLII